MDSVLDYIIELLFFFGATEVVGGGVCVCLCYGLNCVPSRNIETLPSIETITFDVTVFGDSTFVEVIRLNEVIRVGP